MFASLFHRAQVTVDNAIGQAVNRAIMAAPFIVAAGFATAALTSYVTRTYGAEIGYLIVAGAYSFIGLVTVVALRQRPRTSSDGASPVAEEQATGDSAATDANAAEAKSVGDAIDKELLSSAFASAAPLALAPLIRLLLRNLPVVIAVAAAVMVLGRDSTPSDGAASDGESASPGDDPSRDSDRSKAGSEGDVAEAA